MSEFPENFCVLPFIHAVFNGYDATNSNSSILPCCRFDTSKKVETQEKSDPLNKSSLFIELQKQFLNNERPESCKVCWENESLGFKSYRQENNNRYKKIIEDKSFSPNFMDIRILSSSVKQQMLTEDCVSDTVSGYLRETMDSYDEDLNIRLRNYITALDTHHNTSFNAVNPQMAEMLDIA